MTKYNCTCSKGHKWKENHSVRSGLAEFLLGDFARKSNVLRASRCPICGEIPQSSISEDGKQGAVLYLK